MSLVDVASAQGAFDDPSDKDYSVDHLFGKEAIEIPGSIDLNDVPCHDQGSSWHCTAYALTHIVEILNTLEFNLRASCDPEEQWVNQKYDKGNPDYMEKEGDSLQHALTVLLKKSLNNKTPAIDVSSFKIDGFARVNKTVDDLRLWLAKGSPIYTGWNRHCFALVGYSDNDRVFIAKNSFGDKWGVKKNGTFDIPYSDIQKLFTPYIIYDHKDLSMIFKDVSENSPMAEAIKFCLEAGYMKGYGVSSDPKERTFQPNKPVTRAEMAQILFNVFKK